MLLILIPHNLLFSSEISEENRKYRTENRTLYILKYTYWSSCIASGSIGLFSLIGQTANADENGKKIISIYDRIKKDFNQELPELKQFGMSYPMVYFGMHSILSGTAFIPVTGPLIFGTLQYMTGIIFSAVNTISPNNLPHFKNFNGSIRDKVYKDFEEITNSMFDPMPYYTIGTISIILGAAEMILYYYYQREVRRSKYPYFQRIITMIPGGISIGLPL